VKNVISSRVLPHTWRSFSQKFSAQFLKIEDYVESLKEKHLQDLTNFVNGGKSPKVKDKSKTTINLGVRKVVNYDYNELFDDVIESTPATDIFEDEIEWGQKLWAEVANDF